MENVSKSHLFFLVWATLLVFIVVLWFFSPRFVLWKGLDIPMAASKNPETDRASWTLLQLEDPFMSIPDEGNRPIRWRLLFPLLAHYLHFPRILFLMLPHLGALIAIGMMIHLTMRELNHRILSIVTAALMTTGSWFFVSTGWLTYFDSWYIIGLLLVSFIKSRRALVLTCLFMPWVDERFIFALPICMTVRAVYFGWIENNEVRKLWQDCLICLITLLPYVVLRILAMHFYDAEAVDYMGRRLAHQYNVAKCISGTWEGIRTAWVFVALFMLLSFRKKKFWWNLLILLVPICSVIGILPLSGDYSRSMSMVLPAALLGIWLLFRAGRAYHRHILLGALVLNLLLPAHHVVGRFTRPIYYFYHEVYRYRTPPDSFTGIAQYRRGTEKEKTGDLEGAIAAYSEAIRLDPENATAYAQRGIAKSKLGLWQSAVEDYHKALSMAPPKWEYRPRIEKRLQEAFDHLPLQNPKDD